jgi:predicted nucleotidyltransferase
METIDVPNKEELIKVLRQNHVIFAAVFGSRANGMANLKSDYDIMVEFDPRARIGYFKFFDIEKNIANYLKTPVHLITTRGTNKRLHEEINRTMVVLYDQRKTNRQAIPAGHR